MSDVEAMVTTALNTMIERARMLAGDEVAFGIILSLITRELRRSFGVAGAQTFLLDFVASLPSVQSDGEVWVPPADYRVGENERVVWIMTQVIVVHARRLLYDERHMFTLLLRGIADHLGDDARPILIGYEETMAEAAEYDRHPSTRNGDFNTAHGDMVSTTGFITGLPVMPMLDADQSLRVIECLPA